MGRGGNVSAGGNRIGVSAKAETYGRIGVWACRRIGWLTKYQYIPCSGTLSSSVWGVIVL